MPKTITLEMPATRDLGRMRLPVALHERLHELLDRQDRGTKLTARERREAEGLVDMAEWLSLLKMRAKRLSRASA